MLDVVMDDSCGLGQFKVFLIEQHLDIAPDLISREVISYLDQVLLLRNDQRHVFKLSLYLLSLFLVGLFDRQPNIRLDTLMGEAIV